MENQNFHSTAKLHSREIGSNTLTAKFNSAKMQKVCGFCEQQNFLPAKISDNKVFLNTYFRRNSIPCYTSIIRGVVYLENAY